MNGKIISLRAATLRLKYRIRLSKSHSGRCLFSLEDLAAAGGGGQASRGGSRLCKTKLPQHHRVAVRTTAAVIPWGFSPAAVARAVLTSSLRLGPRTFLELMGISRKGTLKRAMLKISCFVLIYHVRKSERFDRIVLWFVGHVNSHRLDILIRPSWFLFLFFFWFLKCRNQNDVSISTEFTASRPRVVTESYLWEKQLWGKYSEN